VRSSQQLGSCSSTDLCWPQTTWNRIYRHRSISNLPIWNSQVFTLKNHRSEITQNSIATNHFQKVDSDCFSFVGFDSPN
jgi:hypothetical protein